MGNNESTAKRNYLMVTEKDYQAALKVENTAEKNVLWRALREQAAEPPGITIAGNCGTFATPQTPCKIQQNGGSGSDKKPTKKPRFP